VFIKIGTLIFSHPYSFLKENQVINHFYQTKGTKLRNMQAFAKYNNGVKNILTVIDIFSKYGWMIPLKSKTGAEVAGALRKIFKERKAEKLCITQGILQ